MFKFSILYFFSSNVYYWACY